MLNKNTNKAANDNTSKETATPRLTSALGDNIGMLKAVLSNDDTIVFREIENVNNRDFSACLIYVDGMVRQDIVNECIIRPVMQAEVSTKGSDGIPEVLKNKIIFTAHILKANTIPEIIAAILSGNAVLLSDGCDEALLIGCQGVKERALDEPSLEKVLRGPMDWAFKTYKYYAFPFQVILPLIIWVAAEIKTRNLKRPA